MSKVITGAKLELRIANKKVAFANNVQYSKTIEVEPVRGIDSMIVDEHSETVINVSFSASMFRVFRESVVSLGIMPKLSAILQQSELTCNIINKHASGGEQTLVKVSGVKCIGISGSVDSRGALVETLNFVGKEMTDEEG